MDKITKTKAWIEMQERLKEMGQEAASQEPTENRVKEFTEPFKYIELNDNNMDYGYQRVSKKEYSRLMGHLDDWNVWNSGKVIKDEGAQYVKQAVDATLACIDRIKNPGAYFRGVLKNIKKSQT